MTLHPSPLDRLLRLGAEPARRRTWPDYRTLGLEPRHAGALIRIATDPALYAAAERDPGRWAPVHAWRALAQLDAAAAAEPLLRLLERELASDWVFDEVPAVLGMLGRPAFPGATLLLFDDARPEEARIAAAHVFAVAGLHHPELRDEAAAVLVKQLEDWAHQGRLLNAYLVSSLVDLQAMDAAPLMEAAFAAGAVDLAVNGDWEDVQVDLGLLAERTTPPPSFPRSHAEHNAARRAAEAARRRRKAEKAARKRNRGR